MISIKTIKEKVLFFAFLGLLAFFIFPTNDASAQLADGKYTVQYTVTNPDNDSASMANDYFVKPATLLVENGAMKVQITMKNSSWMTKFQAESGGNSVISKDASANTRVVQFNVKDLSNPVLAQIRVDIDEMDYHHDYTIRFVFNAGSVALVSGGATETKADTTAKSTETTQTKSSVNSDATASSNSSAESVVENPQTGDTTTTAIFFFMLVASAFLLIRKVAIQK